jgi:hypothetical protein
MKSKNTDELSGVANCSGQADCHGENRSLDRKICEYARLGAVPHCCFAELLEEPVIAPMQPGDDGVIDFFATMAAFHAVNPEAAGHCHGKLAWLAELFIKDNAIRLNAEGGLSVMISAPEAAKLLIQARNFLAEKSLCHSEEIEIDAGEQMLFSTPDPELPPAFIEYLAAVFSPLAEVAAVYVFMAATAASENGTLTIGIEPAGKISPTEADLLSLQIVEGVERFLEEHEQLDFILLDDPELVEIARSVSPPVCLNRPAGKRH